MNEKTRKRAVYAIFVLAVLFGLYMKPWDRPSREESAATITGNPNGEAAAATTHEVDSAQIIGAAVFATNWPSDPFAHRGQGAAAPVISVASDEPLMPLFKLQGMMQLDGQNACVINGEILKAGDRISGWTVESVNANEAILRLGSERQRLRID